jgi:Rhs element Vgr protein
MSQQTFPLSDAATFRPGARIKLRAGYGDSEQTTIFSGIVVRHGLKIAGANDAQLVVECYDETVKMTIGRKSALYESQTDGEAILTLLSANGLVATVASTAVAHPALVQHYCTDRDFMVARAEASGCVVVVDDGKVTVGPPVVSGEPELSVTYGMDLIEFQAELDARHQCANVTAQAWDAKTQAVLLSGEAQPNDLTDQGNLNGATLAQVLGRRPASLQTGAPWPKEALDGWAKAQQLKTGLSRLRGRLRFRGSALAKVGGLVKLQGVGERFNGSVLVTGLTHQVQDGHWVTDAEFGAPAQWFTERADIVAPAASGLIPGIEGLHVGVVLKLDADPAGEHRIQVQVPSANIDRVWARLLQLHASNAFGAFFLPEVGDEVLLGWLNNDPDFPVVLGSLYSSKRAPPHALAADNDVKATVMRCGSKLEFNESDKMITLITPGNNKVVISDKEKSILLEDQSGNRVALGPEGITLDSPKNIKFSAKGNIDVDAASGLRLSSKADVKVRGLNVNCVAQESLVAKGSASAELSAAGQTTVKGAMVMIN